MTTASRPAEPTNPIDPFLADMEILFDGRLVSYADIGANDGSTFSAVMRSGLRINRCLLAEPNPKCFGRLQRTIASFGDLPDVESKNLALSDEAGPRVLQDNNDMSMIVAEPKSDSDRQITVDTKRLDDFSDFFPEGHISILKIDVEGHELEVLKGASAMLEVSAIDVVYVEACIGSERAGSTGLRPIEDLLSSYGYRIFKFYEQTQDWIEDRPVLTRCNAAFLSNPMISRYPLSLLTKQKQLRDDVAKTRAIMEDHQEKTRVLMEAQQAEHERALAERYAEIAALTEMLAEGPTPASQGHAALPLPRTRNTPTRMKPYRTKIGPFYFRPQQIYGLLFTVAGMLGVAALYFYLEMR